MKVFVALALLVGTVLSQTFPPNDCFPELSWAAPVWEGGGPLDGFRASDFNVISFNSFKANSGDIQGRLFVADAVKITGGFSIGYEIRNGNSNLDAYRNFSLVVGDLGEKDKNICWKQGSLYPDGTGVPYNGTLTEGYFHACYQMATGCFPEYLADRQAGFCPHDELDCLDDVTEGLFEYYDSLVEIYESLPDNANYTLADGDRQLTIEEPFVDYGGIVKISINNSCWNYASYINISDVSLRYIIEIVNDNDKPTYFHQNELAVPAEHAVFVLPDQGEENYNPPVRVLGAVTGSILAPTREYTQSHGVTHGMVVAGEINGLTQANRMYCSQCEAPYVCGTECCEESSCCGGTECCDPEFEQCVTVGNVTQCEELP